ncbi:hypothetical protein FOZ62_010309, partial [Perkinsus olseni]
VEAGRLDRAWANVRSKSKGEASLEDFTIWYKGNFRAAGGSSGSSGAESKGMDKVLGLAMRTPWSHDNVKDVAGWHSARRSKTGVPTRGSLRPSEPLSSNNVVVNWPAAVATLLSTSMCPVLVVDVHCMVVVFISVFFSSSSVAPFSFITMMFRGISKKAVWGVARRPPVNTAASARIHPRPPTMLNQ